MLRQLVSHTTRRLLRVATHSALLSSATWRLKRTGAIFPQSRGVSRWPRTIRIREDASVTTAEPAIAVTRDQVIDRVADRPWDEMEEPCPPPARKLARDAQHGVGFYIALTVRHKCKGIRVIRIDAEPLSERTSLGQLDRNEVKIAAAITFADKAAAARAQDVRIRPCGELMPPGLFGSTPRDGRRNRGDRRLRACLER